MERPFLASRFANAAGLALALLTTVLVYWPSTHGGYVFDDYANIVENREVHLQSLDWDSLRTAALSSPSPLLIRPLAMLSFGIDWRIADGDPFEMKLVNLAIHLINGLLLFALLRVLVRYESIRGIDRQPPCAVSLLPLYITTAWLLAPINFTAVAYIVQRMESLCQIFVLAGLYGYAAARVRMLEGQPGLLRASAWLIVGTALGALVKESAVLLPAYAFALEWIVFRFAGVPGDAKARRLWLLFTAILFVPACLAAAWAIRHSLSPGPWINRPFTLGERLLTEPRILLDYLRWSALPIAGELALYHDQIAVSRSLFDSPSTVGSIAVLLLAAGLVPVLRRQRPLAALGIAWFLVAHVLTGTIVPLELVFEHRNYFASIGVYLAVFSVLLPTTPQAALPTARWIGAAAFIALFAFVTLLRAKDWSNPVSFALSEAGKNPGSPRTAYELGRTYVVLSRYRADSPLIPLAYSALERAAAMPGADALPDQGLLLLSGRLHRPTDPAVWQRLEKKLASQPLSVQNVSALHALSQCAADGDCDFPAEHMVDLFMTVMRRTSTDTRILAIYANYAINVLHDEALAINLARAGVEQQPQDLQARKNLLLVLEVTGHHEEAGELYRRTLREVPGAARDAAFRELGTKAAQYPLPAPDGDSKPQLDP